jgi:hypothetical protein
MTETIISIILGIGLAASVGFRVFVPLFGLSLAAHFGMVPLNENWEWIGGNTALITLGIATVVEIIAYFIPFFDHLLDVIMLPMATIAGTAIMVSTVVNIDPTLTWALAIIAGGGTATAIKTSTSSTRLASTGTTAGIANPLVSTIETGTSISMSVLAIFAPILAIIFLIIIFGLIYKFFKFLKR